MRCAWGKKPIRFGNLSISSTQNNAQVKRWILIGNGTSVLAFQYEVQSPLESGLTSSPATSARALPHILHTACVPPSSEPLTCWSHCMNGLPAFPCRKAYPYPSFRVPYKCYIFWPSILSQLSYSVSNIITIESQWLRASILESHKSEGWLYHIFGVQPCIRIASLCLFSHLRWEMC